MLAQVFPHGDGCRDTDIETLDLPELGDHQGLDIGIGGDIGTDAVFFVPEYKRTPPGKGDLGERGPLDRVQREKRIAARTEILVTAFKMRMKARRNPLEGSHGRRRIEKIDAHQMHFTGPEGVCTSENFTDIEGRLETIQDNNEIVGAWTGCQIGIFLPPEPPLGRYPFLMNASADLSESHESLNLQCWTI